MILYVSDGGWLDLVFRNVGTVWPSIRFIFLFTTLYTVAAFLIAVRFDFNFGSEGKTILISTMSFLLIFRANQAYARYWQGRNFVSTYFSDIRELILLSFIYLRGGIASSTHVFNRGLRNQVRSQVEDGFDSFARDARVDIVRLSVALAVSLKLHSRIALDGYCFGAISSYTKWRLDWDRFRLRQLLTEDEFTSVDECVGVIEVGAKPAKCEALKHLAMQFRGPFDQPCPENPPSEWPSVFEFKKESEIHVPVAVAFLLREVIYRNVNDNRNKQPWGMRERYVTSLASLIASSQQAFEQIHQIITTPLPLPYANLCKTLLSIFLLSMPFFVEYQMGWFVNCTIPPLVSLALLGIDAIATELENPFGDDDNDLDILEHIHVLECEAMEMLSLAGDPKGCGSFCWRMMPNFVEVDSCRTLRRQLAVKEYAAPEVVTVMGSVESLESWVGSSGSWSMMWSSSEDL